MTARLRNFFTGAGLPVFLLTAMVVYEGFLLAIVFAPGSAGVWSGFAIEFKQWCFRYDPRTGGMEWPAFWLMLIEPAAVAIFAAFLSLRSLTSCTRQWKSALTGAVAGMLVIAGLYLYGRPATGAEAPLPFPGERIRTHIQPPPFQFVDQTGAAFSLEQLRGRVVLLTGVYAACSTGACSIILAETKSLLDSLPPEARPAVVALSLDPARDSAEVRGTVAQTFGFTHPAFRYLGGDEAALHDVAKRFGFAPVRDPATGVVEHANLFILLDAHGEIAYRFTLDERHRPWLREAVLSLAGEVKAS